MIGTVHVRKYYKYHNTNGQYIIDPETNKIISSQIRRGGLVCFHPMDNDWIHDKDIQDEEKTYDQGSYPKEKLLL